MRNDNLRQSTVSHLLTILFLIGLLSDALPAQAQDHPVRILLENEQHQPVADATVWVVTANLGGLKQQATELSKGTSGQDGRVNVAISDLWMSTPPALRQELAFICYKPGHDIAALAVWRDSPLQDAELVLTLPKSTSTPIQVKAPDNQAVPQGTVRVSALAVDTLRVGLDEKTASSNAAARNYKVRKFSWGYAISQTPMLLPSELQQKLTYKLDGQGRATVEGVGTDAFGIIDIDTETHGGQKFYRNVFAAPGKQPRNKSWPGQIRLSPVGKITGQVVSTPPELHMNRKVAFTTRPPNTAIQTQDLLVFGFVEVPLTADGKFEVPALATGDCSWGLVAVPDEKAVVLNAPPAFSASAASLQVNAGKTTTVEVKLGVGIPVRGTVVDSVTDKPLANTVVVGFHGSQYDSVVTDKDGKYQFLCAPGQVAAHAGAPAGYFPKLRTPESLPAVMQVTATQKEFELPPIKLDPAVTCTGVAVDAENKPIANAEIHATWKGRNRQSETATWSHLTINTNEHGEFQIKGLDPGECWIWGEFNGAFSDKAIAVTAKNFQDLKMTISPHNQVIFKGKLTDAEGHSVTRATIDISRRPPGDPSIPAVAVPVKADSIKIDSAGAFELLPLPPHYEYQLTIKAPNCLPLTLARNVPKGSGSQDLGDVVLKMVGNVAGTIVDRQGNPVVNAKVISLTSKTRTESTTADNGSFRFDAAEKDGFLIVDHPEFRCTGRQLSQLKAGLQLVLVRKVESVSEPFQPPSNGLNAEAQRKLADELLEPLLKADSKASDQEKMQAIRTKATWDPLGALELLEAGRIKTPQMSEAARGEIAKALLKDKVDAALELIDTIKDDSARPLIIRALVQSPDVPLDKKRELLADGYVRVKALKAPELRVCFQGLVAEALWDLGEKKQAETMLQEGLELARKLPVSEFGGYARGCFAEELAAIDLPAALELIKNLKDPFEFDRHHANIAQELADRNPAESQRVFNMLKPVDPAGNRFDSKNTYAIRICHRMALVDLPRAISIAASLTDEYARAQCYGIIADALVPTDKAKALELIEQAFQSLQSRMGKPRERLASPYTVGESAGSLLPTIERLDPQLVPESAWRCLSLVGPVILDNENRYYTTEDKWQLVMFIGMYDVSIAKTILGWVNTAEAESYSRVSLPALTVVDPVAASAKINSHTDPRQSNRDRITAAKILGRQGAERLREIRRAASLWNIDVEDIDP